MSLSIWNNFKGVVPGVDESLLAAGFARRAHNVKLCHGRLDPWREPLALRATKNSTHLRGDKWFDDDRCDRCYVDIDPCGDTIMSGDDMCPVRIDCDTCEQTTLGFPCPDTPEIVSNTVSEDGAFTDYAHYIIAYSDGCDTGAPSAPTQGIKYNKGDKTVLSLPQPDSKYNNATEICIYRLHSTWDAAKGMWAADGGSFTEGLQDVTTEACYFLIDCVPVGTAQYCDEGKSATEQICDTLVTECYEPPVEGLKITGMTQLGSLVGFKDDQLYFSERNTHYAWPGKYCITIGCEIRHVCVHENTVFVLTDGYPFVVTDYPEATEQWCREPRKASKPAPIASAKSAVCIDGTAVYATPWALVALDATAQVREISGEFCHDNFEAICPSTIRAACWRGDYVFSSANYSAIYTDLLSEGESNLSTIDICADCWITGKDGCLYFTKNGCVYRWDAGEEYLRMEYETALNSSSGERCNTVARIVHTTKRRECSPCDTLFTYIGDDCELFCRDVDHSECFNIPRRRVYDFRVKVEGKRSVRRIEAGPNRSCFSVAA